MTGAQKDATLDYFRSRKISFVLVDAPDSDHFTVMPGMNAITNRRLAYFRLHGRNAAGYISGRSVPDRFNYDYPREEVEQIADRVRAVQENADENHIAANNNRSSYGNRAVVG